MDLFDLGEGHSSLVEGMKKIKCPVLVIGNLQYTTFVPPSFDPRSFLPLPFSPVLSPPVLSPPVLSSPIPSTPILSSPFFRPVISQGEITIFFPRQIMGVQSDMLFPVQQQRELEVLLKESGNSNHTDRN